MGATPSAATWGTIAQAADVFHVSQDTIRRAIARGELEAVRFGPKLIRVNLASVTSAARPLGAAVTS